MERKRKVALVVGDATKGGVISCVYNFVRRRPEGFETDVFVNGETPYRERLERASARVFSYPKVFSVLSCVARLRKKFRKEKYDVVHVHMTTLSFVPLFAALLAGVKVRICHAHSTTHRDEGFRYFVKNALRPLNVLFATHLAACSEKAARWMYGKRKNVFVLRNAVDETRFVYDETYADREREKYGLKRGKTFGFVGRLERQKNVLFLADILAEAVGRDEEIKLLIAGDGSLRGKFLDRCAALGVRENVLFWKEEGDVGKVYSLFDVFLLPSLYEGSPLVAVEAQVSGLPCLLSDTVTKECAFTPSVRFLPATDGKEWAEEGIKQASLPRFDNGKYIPGSGYSLEEERRRLYEYYKECVDE